MKYLSAAAAATLAVAVAAPLRAAPTLPGDLTGPQPRLAATQLPDEANVAQCAFDGDESTAYQSAGPVRANDALTLTLTEPAATSQVRVVVGDETGGSLAQGLVLELSTDGQNYGISLPIEGAGVTYGLNAPLALQAVRVRATADSDQPLIVRELWLTSQPGVPRIAYPLEVTVDAQAADLAEWGAMARDEMMLWYPYFAELLAGEAIQPPRHVKMVLREMDGVAYASGGEIHGAAKWFRDHPDDVGAMIHELIHVIQSYPRYDPGWLVEGLDDWARWWIYEPENRRPQARPGGNYTDSYQRTGAFLAWIEAHRAPGLMAKINNAMRLNTYAPELWVRWAGADLDTLWAQYQASFEN